MREGNVSAERKQKKGKHTGSGLGRKDLRQRKTIRGGRVWR